MSFHLIVSLHSVDQSIHLPHFSAAPQLNGRRVRTPLALADGAKVLTSGSYTLLDTSFGLQVKFDGVHHLEVVVPGDYFNKVRSPGIKLCFIKRVPTPRLNRAESLGTALMTNGVVSGDSAGRLCSRAAFIHSLCVY